MAAISVAELEGARDRAKIALLVAAAHGVQGHTENARQMAQQALNWGCHKEIAARVLIGAAYNNLACVAAALEEDSDARNHFTESVQLVEPHADAKLLSRTRQIRETMRLGLLPEASEILEREMQVIRENPADHSDRLAIIGSDISLLKHELSIALTRGQIYPDTSPKNEAELSRLAVSQLGQDLWVLERSGHKREGFFVEFGATDGVTLSNTWLLEKHFGWTGICADPNPKFFAQLQDNRTCQVSNACIAGKSGETVEFILADAFGGIAEFADVDTHKAKRQAYKSEGHVISVQTISLDDFLTDNNAPQEIDYLSIDTEGSEYEILKDFPFDKWKIQRMTVEHNFTENRLRIRELLEKHGYQCTERDFDDWYELS